jgi:ADP-dependent NAD(P)H-hydrate dehydratase
MSPMPPPSPADSVVVTPVMLRRWPLHRPEGTKDARGRVLIVGGSAETPGAVLLAAEAALRSGAGKLQIATVASAAPLLAAAIPEALVRGLAETPAGAIAPDAAAHVLDLARDAAAVLVGPGMDDADAITEFLERLLPELSRAVVLDALAMARITADMTAVRHLDGRAVLTPNTSELATTLGAPEEEVNEHPHVYAGLLAVAANAVVAVGGTTSSIAAPDGRVWQDETGGPGLAVSGSGDVRAGIVAGLLARGASPEQAGVWGTFLHGRAGERLAGSSGGLGFLARELPFELPRVLAEVEQ